MSRDRNTKVRWVEMFPDEIQKAIRTCPVCLAAYTGSPNPTVRTTLSGLISSKQTPSWRNPLWLTEVLSLLPSPGTYKSDLSSLG